MHKKGDISMNYIIVAAIALIALVIIVLFFTGGLQTLFQKQKETVEGATSQQLEIWRGQCKLYCSLNQKENFCSHNFEVKDKDGKVQVTWKCNTATTICPSAGTYEGTLDNLAVECTGFKS